MTCKSEDMCLIVIQHVALPMIVTSSIDLIFANTEDTVPTDKLQVNLQSSIKEPDKISN
jgi:hypothetical protein